ncbi:ATP-binding protein [Oenococcus alcoholitolerans]|uniref:HAMP domain-containing sensor histidine kinase n=1 Tax=Oenococcus alcoholitolerans TaxID=931074 RepID=UPI003F7232B7
MKYKKLLTIKNNQRPYFSWRGYLLILSSFLIFGSLPGVLYTWNSHNWRSLFNNSYLGWYLLYWVIFAAFFSALIAYRRYRDFDLPVQRLSQAAKKVAQGDFSVYLPPLHRSGKYDYLDILFENFNLMVSELGSTETLKNNFISNVSHEFKGPLAVIRGYADSLTDKNISQADRQRYIDSISKATEDLAELVTNILRLNKLENQKIPVKLTYFDLSRQLAEAALSVEKNWEDKQIDFQAELMDDCVILADEQMLSIVWNNLLANAIKFTPAKGQIFLKQFRQDQGVLVVVADSGIGMSNTQIGHIFEQFYQGDHSHSGSGNGLGLAMVKKIVDLADGTISVKSKKGEGSSFSVWLPLKKENN